MLKMWHIESGTIDNKMVTETQLCSQSFYRLASENGDQDKLSWIVVLVLKEGTFGRLLASH